MLPVIGAARCPSSARDPSPPAAAAPDYTSDTAWLCLPGRADSLRAPLPTADLNPEGFGPAAPATPAANPPIDCFYVYPTVSRDPGLNSDLDMGATEERGAAFVQAARFAAAAGCSRPVYRSLTLGSLAPIVPRAALGADLRHGLWRRARRLAQLSRHPQQRPARSS